MRLSTWASTGTWNGCRARRSRFPNAVSPKRFSAAVPQVYPFIVNDPGEGTQAKRRTSAVIIDHLTPPLTPGRDVWSLRDLEALLDEYYDAVGLDPQRLEILHREILSLSSATGLDIDAGLTGNDGDEDLARLDAWLCDVKEAQIRDGLHVFGQSPHGTLERNLVQALVRLPRGNGTGADASLHRALADDLELGFDPLDCDMSAKWRGPTPAVLAMASEDRWRSAGDTVERIEALASDLLDGMTAPPGTSSREVLDNVPDPCRSSGTFVGPGRGGRITGPPLDGKFVQPGPSGAPTSGRLDVLPTGRNFFSVDSRSIPTPTAWTLGWKSAAL